VDTPGGRVDAAIEITKHIRKATCPSIAFIEGMGAISAGAIISYSCDHIIMTEGTSIGASAPFMMGMEVSDEINEKSNSYVRSLYRSLGDENGHNTMLGEAMVDWEIELIGYEDENGEFIIEKVRNGNVVERSRPPGSEKGESDAIDEIFESIEKDSDIKLDGVKRKVRELLGEQPPDEDMRPEPKPRRAMPDGAIVISEKGELLTLTSSEAKQYGLISKIVPSLDEAMDYYEVGGVVKRHITPTWSEALYAFLTSPMISGLLLMCAMGGIYVEVRTPGFGLPGIVGVTCLAIFFGSHLVIGLADWVDLLLVMIGLTLIVVEVFVLPGFGLVGAAGFLCLLAGLYMSLTRVTIPQYSWDFMRLTDAGQTVTLGAGLFLILALLSWKVFPKTPMFRWLVLADAQLTTEGYTVQVPEEAQSCIGMQGVASSKLHPAGKGRFAGKTFDVVTRGEFIEAGQPIEIIESEGNRYVVTETRED
jgi:membrane-bound serine protease (ClpP class)